MLLQWLEIIGAIILVDLTLSGDNALVIGAVASRLTGTSRRRAITLGGAFAIILRIVITIGASFFLNLPFVKAIGGLVVFIIATQLMQDIIKSEKMEESSRSSWHQRLSTTTLLGAIFAITLADLSMSLDNILAIAALANGVLAVIIIGLLLSVFLLLVASSLLAKLIERFPLLLYLAGIILAWTAGVMVYTDHSFSPLLHRLDDMVPGPSFAILVPLVMTLVIAVIILIVEIQRQRLVQLHQARGPVSQPR